MAVEAVPVVVAAVLPGAVVPPEVVVAAPAARRAARRPSSYVQPCLHPLLHDVPLFSALTRFCLPGAAPPSRSLYLSRKAG